MFTLSSQRCPGLYRILEMLAALPRIGSGWDCFFFSWVELWCIFIFLTIVAFLYGIFWLDIMPVRWSYVRVVFVLRRPSILTGRVTFVRVLAFSYQFCYELRFSLQFSSYDIHCESSRFSIFWEGGLLCNLYAWQHKNFNSEHVGY
jgi:hypothetical protein